MESTTSGIASLTVNLVEENSERDDDFSTSDSNESFHSVSSSILSPLFLSADEIDDTEFALLNEEEEKEKEGSDKSVSESSLLSHHDSAWRVISGSTSTCRAVVNSIAFNQDKNSICIGTNIGYRVRSIERTGIDRVMIHESTSSNGVSFCQMLHCTSLLAVMKTVSPRTLSMINAKSGNSLCDLNFTAAVRRVEMNRKTMITLTADGVLHAFDTGSLKLITSVPVLHRQEPGRFLLNRNATTHGAYFDLSKNEEHVWLVCKSTDDMGTVDVRDGIDLKIVSKVKAHSHPIARMAIGGQKENQRLATASKKGTVIRVFTLPQCQKLYTLWRGSNPCTIFSIAFSTTAHRIVVSGSTGTIHIYRTDRDHDQQTHHTTLTDRITNVIQSTGIPNLLPDRVSDKTDGLRSFARIKLKVDKVGGPVVPNTVALEDWEGGEDTLIVVTNEARMYQFRILPSGLGTPIRADDLLFDDDTVEECNGLMLTEN